MREAISEIEDLFKTQLKLIYINIKMIYVENIKNYEYRG
ncbi:MAG: hypothetical protein BAJALOKI3v1_30063 [Promethearchaeota archaeon]|nr:MAG: hypothetical protein BAJALOKI3v1_30063 [Candidatus Lokiarchaeota archaeon]